MKRVKMQIWYFSLTVTTPLVKPVRWNEQRLFSTACLNDGFSSSVSDLALIIRCPMLGSGAHDGTSPHFIIFASFRHFTRVEGRHRRDRRD